MKQWKKFVGYDQWDQSLAGKQSANPGPIDNSNLFKGMHEMLCQAHLPQVNHTASQDFDKGTLKEHLMEELDYYLLCESAWAKLLSWYGLTQGSKPIPR